MNRCNPLICVIDSKKPAEAPPVPLIQDIKSTRNNTFIRDDRQCIKCSFCKKPGHTEENCWSKHPEKRPKWGSRNRSAGYGHRQKSIAAPGQYYGNYKANSQMISEIKAKQYEESLDHAPLRQLNEQVRNCRELHDGYIRKTEAKMRKDFDVEGRKTCEDTRQYVMNLSRILALFKEKHYFVIMNNRFQVYPNDDRRYWLWHQDARSSVLEPEWSQFRFRVTYQYERGKRFLAVTFRDLFTVDYDYKDGHSPHSVWTAIRHYHNMAMKLPCSISMGTVGFGTDRGAHIFFVDKSRPYGDMASLDMGSALANDDLYAIKSFSQGYSLRVLPKLGFGDEDFVVRPGLTLDPKVRKECLPMVTKYLDCPHLKAIKDFRFEVLMLPNRDNLEQFVKLQLFVGIIGVIDPELWGLVNFQWAFVQYAKHLGPNYHDQHLGDAINAQLDPFLEPEARDEKRKFLMDMRHDIKVLKHCCVRDATNNGHTSKRLRRKTNG